MVPLFSSLLEAWGNFPPIFRYLSENLVKLLGAKPQKCGGPSPRTHDSVFLESLTIRLAYMDTWYTIQFRFFYLAVILPIVFACEPLLRKVRTSFIQLSNSPILGAAIHPGSSPLIDSRSVDFLVRSAFSFLLRWNGDFQATYIWNQKLEVCMLVVNTWFSLCAY